jgi:serine/threonine protein kinase
LAAVSHPNIPAIYDVEFKPETEEFKIFYSWIDGITIHKYLIQNGILSLEEVRKYFNNICSALSETHSKGIIHRDIKPSNLIVTNNLENCYLVDFGISLTTKDIDRLTDNSNGLGTPGYMSPEQEDNEDLDCSTDVYSLAIVLYECLSGGRPSIGEYKPLNSINEAIPSLIDVLIRECLLPKQKRIKTIEEFNIRLIQALRPSANFRATFSKGALSDVVASLQGLNHTTFNNLPVGQKTLLLVRFKTLIATDI